ncbi:MAG: hypothetical protein ACREIC_07935, partial [Limisphaerales bacterium]
TYPLAMPEKLVKEVRKTAKATGLSMADAMRQSMKLGLPKLREQLCLERITNVEPLPKRVLERIYDQRKEDLDSIRQFIGLQAKDAE